MGMSLRRAGRIAIGLAAAFFIASCGGGTTGPNNSTYFVRFKANGSQVEFTNPVALAAGFGHSGTQYNMLVTGFDATSNANIQVFDGSAISAKTYSGYGVVGSAFVGSLIGYQPPGGPVYASNATVTVTITGLSATTVSGTFEGTVSATGHANIQVTEGEFSVKRSN